MARKTETVMLRCDDNAEAVVFNKYTYHYDKSKLDIDYEINIEDSYCGGDFMGIKGRFKRAWHAFFAKPVYYSGIYIEDKNRVKKWLEDCLAMIDSDGGKDDGSNDD